MTDEKWDGKERREFWRYTDDQLKSLIEQIIGRGLRHRMLIEQDGRDPRKERRKR